MTVSLNHPMVTTGGSSGTETSAHITNVVPVTGNVTAHVVNQVSAHIANAVVTAHVVNQVSAFITGTVGVTGNTSAHIINQVSAHIANAVVTAHVVNQVSAYIANAAVSAHVVNQVHVSGQVSAFVGNTAYVIPTNFLTLKSVAGTTVSGNNEPVARVAAKKIKVVGFSLSTIMVSATICKFLDGTAGTSKWQVILQTTSGNMAGANLATSPPAWLFETSVSAPLVLNTDSGSTIHYAVSYFEEA